MIKASAIVITVTLLSASQANASCWSGLESGCDVQVVDRPSGDSPYTLKLRQYESSINDLGTTYGQQPRNTYGSPLTLDGGVSRDNGTSDFLYQGLGQ